MRKLIGLVLVSFLMLGMATPAMAQDEADPAMPVITLQPQPMTALCGMRFTLRVEAHCPNGDPVGYEWHRITGALNQAYNREGPALFLEAEEEEGETSYQCVVYNAALGKEAGKVASETVVVTRRLGTAAQRMEQYREELAQWPSIKEGLAEDPLFINNNALDYALLCMSVAAMWVADRRGTEPEFLQQFEQVFLILTSPLYCPGLAVFIVLIGVPVSAVARALAS